MEVVAHIVPWLFTWGEEPRGGEKGGLLYLLPQSHGGCSIVGLSAGGDTMYFPWETHGSFPFFLSLYELGISAVLKKPTETHPMFC